MDFFRLQNRAKRQTFWLVILYLIGLIVIPFIGAYIITLSIDLFCMLMTTYDTHRPTPYQDQPISTFSIILVSLTGIILLVSHYKYTNLTHGGARSVAISLGGRLIDKKTADPNERRLLNIVEEMAIAANMPIPQVYLLDRESNINAFAAGYTINDAVIGVTFGSIELLDRDELQAIVGHELSHILNGDMRLNLNFTALLFGFIFVSQTGRLMFRHMFENTSKHDKTKKIGIPLPLPFAVLAITAATSLLVAGWIGQIWARVMQASINIQREYLADASSVQFTRNKQALASALKKIGGCEGKATLKTPMAGTYSHLFFGQSDSSLLETHPPLKKRIKRIEPWWRGNFIKVDFIKLYEKEAQQLKLHLKKKIKDPHLTKAIATGITITGNDSSPYLKPVSLLNTHTDDKDLAVAKLEAICNEPMDSCYLMFALLLDSNPSIRAKQLTAVKNTALIIDYYQTLSLVPQEKHLDFIEKAIPSLKNLSVEQYKRFKTILMHFIKADNDISIREWLIYQLIIHQADGEFDSNAINTSHPYHKLEQVKEAVTILLSAIVHLIEDPYCRKRAFTLGSNGMGLYTLNIYEKPSIKQLTESLQKLQKANEDIRKLFLLGVLRAIEHDQQINPKKRAFFRILSLCLDCPISMLNRIVFIDETP